MDGLKEIYDSMTSRLKSHVFGSIAVSFILWNWKVIYVLCFSEMPIFLRFTYFNMNTSNASLYYWPIGLGLIFGLGAPWVNAAAHWIVSRPLSYIKSRDELSALMREGRLEDKKLEVEQKKTAVQDEKLKAVDLVKKQQSAENSLRERQRELTDAEKKLDTVQGRVNSQIQQLEELEVQVAKAENAKVTSVNELEDADNVISETAAFAEISDLSLKEFLALYALSLADQAMSMYSLFETGGEFVSTLSRLSKLDGKQRLKVEVTEGAELLTKSGLARSLSSNTGLKYELTSSGYATLDQFKAMSEEDKNNILNKIRGEF